MNWLHLWAFAGSLAGLGTQFMLKAAVAHQIADHVTIQDVAGLVASNWEKISKLQVEMLSAHASDENEDLFTSLAVSGADRVVKSTHGGLTPDADPRSWQQFLAGGEWNVFRPYWRRYEVSRRFAFGPYTDKITGHMFFEATGWWPSEDSARPLRLQNGRSYFISDVLRDDEYVVATTEDVIDGRQCALIERHGFDRLWVDLNRGTLLRRECYEGDFEKPVIRFDLRDYRHVSDGVWLPFQIVRIHRPAGVHTIHRIVSYKLNGDVPMNSFEFVPPPGTLIHNRDTDEFEQVPGGLDFFTEVIQRAADSVDRREPSWQRKLFPALAGFLLVCIVIAARGRTNAKWFPRKDEHEQI